MSRPLQRSSGDDDLAQSLASLNIGSQDHAAQAVLKVFYHASCLNHRFTRPDFDQPDGRQIEAHDASIVERPERLRAVLAGVHAAMARHPGRIALQTTEAILPLTSAAVQSIHGPLQATDDSDYARALQDWLKNVDQQHRRGNCEIPSGYSQTDLYLAAGPAGSQSAIEGALGAACLAIDEVCQAPAGGVRFVACRPPGHHCGRDSPSGFCFVNNVAVALQHAHDHHDIDRVLIFDVDLHHGNGTQSLVWDINSKAAVTAASMRTPAGSPKGKHKTQQKRPLKVFYGSLHDILSFPCESGDPQLVANASVRLAAHDQHICNVHLKPYTSANQFHAEVYPTYQQDLFGAATQFCKATQADPAKTLIVISAGMDACELEYTSMSRHNRRVPVSFYNRFARDVTSFASDPDTFSPPSPSPRQPTRGKPVPRIVGMLEGGYSDAALMSGTASLLQGLTAYESEQWYVNQIEAKDIPLLDKACCVNPPPPNMIKRLPPWAMQAGEQLCLFLNESREEWNRAKERQAELKARADQLADPNGPRALRERKEPKKYAEDDASDAKPRNSGRQKTPQATPSKKPPRTRPWDDAGAPPVVLSEVPLHPSAPISEAIDPSLLAQSRTPFSETKPILASTSKPAPAIPSSKPTQIPLPDSPAPAPSSGAYQSVKPEPKSTSQPHRGLPTVKSEDKPLNTFSNPWPSASHASQAVRPLSLAELAEAAEQQLSLERKPAPSGEQPSDQSTEAPSRHLNIAPADETKQKADALFLNSVASFQRPQTQADPLGNVPTPNVPTVTQPSDQQVKSEEPSRNQVKFTWQGAQLGGS